MPNFFRGLFYASNMTCFIFIYSNSCLGSYAKKIRQISGWLSKETRRTLPRGLGFSKKKKKMLVATWKLKQRCLKLGISVPVSRKLRRSFCNCCIFSCFIGLVSWQRTKKKWEIHNEKIFKAATCRFCIYLNYRAANIISPQALRVVNCLYLATSLTTLNLFFFFMLFPKIWQTISISDFSEFAS